MADRSRENAASGQHDNNPRSLLGRIWRWHAGWAPRLEVHYPLPNDRRTELPGGSTVPNFHGQRVLGEFACG